MLPGLARLMPCFLFKFSLCLYEEALPRSRLEQPGSRLAAFS